MIETKLIDTLGFNRVRFVFDFVVDDSSGRYMKVPEIDQEMIGVLVGATATLIGSDPFLGDRSASVNLIER